MPGFCTYRRQGNVWVLIEGCTEPSQKDCPTIPNFRLTNSPNIHDAGGEPAFLQAFRTATIAHGAAEFPSEFSFQDDDLLTLLCDPVPESETRTSEYIRNNQVIRTFRLKRAGPVFEVEVVPPAGVAQ